MEVELKQIRVRDIVAGYADNGDDGVVAFGGKLDVRPPYQREFIYKDKQRDAVIDTVIEGFPLNVLYWVDREDGSYEILDGQQRTISICQFVNKEFSINEKYFDGLPKNIQKDILDYELMVYFCKGTDSEKLDWFEVVNVAGEPLNAQELRNAVYAGEWLSDAKRWFSKRGCAAYGIGSDYVKGSPINQDYLQTAIAWVAGDKSEEAIRAYMGEHEKESHATALWNHFESVINWVKSTFPNYRKEMKGVDWGGLYDKHKDDNPNPAGLEESVKDLMMDDDVTNKKGIYSYVLDGDSHHLNIRAFTDTQKRQKYEEQGGRCAISGAELPISEMEADHIVPWSKGGKTEAGNLQMISKQENRRKGAK